MLLLNKIFSVKPKGKTLIIHIGDHKTGSTTLQNAFATQKVFLKGAKIFYPANLNHNYLLRVFQDAARSQESPFKPTPGSPGLEELRQQITETDADYILISGEQFEHIDIDEFKFVIDRWFSDIVDRIRIIAYVRPHAQRFVSNFTEVVKIGTIDGDFDAYYDHILETHSFHYTKRFSRLRKIYGKNFILRPMITSELRNGSVLDDFIHTAFDGLTFEIEPFNIDNKSVDLDELMFLKFIQARFDTKDRSTDIEYVKRQKFIRHTMAREIVSHLSSFERRSSPKKLRLHKAIADKLKDQYWEDACALDKAFFKKRTLFQGALQSACDNAPLQPMSLNPEDYFTPEDLRYLTALREILWNALQTQKNWADIFHNSRINRLHGKYKSSDV